MFVKICGTTNLPDAELAVEHGADAVGFIFAPSKRRVTAEQVAEITQFLPQHVERIGVFTEPEADEIARTVSAARLSAVQMHWTYDRAVVGAICSGVGEGIKLWQVVGFAVNPPDARAADEVFARTLREALLDPRLEVVLLDSVKDGASGGQGLAFPWARAGQLIQLAYEAAKRIRQSQGLRGPKLVVAGGLNADNVRDAIVALRPWGVDVVTGVEMGPGRKDPDRVREFIETAHDVEERDVRLHW